MSSSTRILTVFGTRPEAVKLAPVLTLLAADRRFESRSCNTGQHREMTDQALRLFDIRPDFSLRIMRPDQSLPGITAAILQGLERVFGGWKPDAVLVQGDTNTTFAAALAAFYRSIPVAHLEAGLRTHDLKAPFPEEGNRRMTSALASLHFAPTLANARHLRSEGVAAKDIIVTGNTAVDAAVLVRSRVAARPPESWKSLPPQLRDPARDLILVTGHRRENLGPGLAAICRALAELARRCPGAVIAYPVHLNPHVRRQVKACLPQAPNIFLLPPLDYETFAFLMSRARFLLTDSGGIQEEAPVFGKPVLLTREVSERPEALRAGTARLVGTDPRRIVAESLRLLRDPRARARMSPAANPFGDGKAAARVVKALRARFPGAR